MDISRQKKVEAFVDRWTGRGYEKGESQVFWIELLQEVLDVDTPSHVISFESQVKLSHTSFIDAYIESTHVMIEQKSIDKDLRAPVKQSDGSMLTPFQQAKRYSSELPYSLRPRWVITCNFRSFLIYDMEQPQGEPYELLLEDLPREWTRLQFLVEDKDPLLKHEMEVSIKAGAMVGRIYEAFLKQYNGNETDTDLHWLNVLCVRLVFCLYAEDAGVFGKDQFYHFMKTFNVENMRMGLKNLFEVLDTPLDQRDPFLEEKYNSFPYVSGSLFHRHPGEIIPPLTPETAHFLLEQASLDFDWSDISPTIFGAVFESTLNPDTRRAGGMHYTSIENIHKVIDPLFMDELNEQFATIKAMPRGKQREQRLLDFQQHLASLRFLDPACGSGNFLTESFVSLRRLENKVIEQLTGGQALLGFEEVSPIKVSIYQFYGIEINDFAVTVAATALWIAEAQMMNETARIIQFKNDYLPLNDYHNIHHGNALRMPWEDVVDPKELNYIIGNPPFVGYSLQSKEQKEDILSIYIDEKGKPYKTAGKIDYVAGWYWKASEMMATAYQNGHVIRSALVSTNSVTQGEQVASIWKPLYDRFNIHIDFAWRTFRWDSESTLKAHVHCVIVGFSVAPNGGRRRLFISDERCDSVDNINAYLIGADDVFVVSRKKTLCSVPEMQTGNRPADGGHLIIEKDDYHSFVSNCPDAKPYIKRLIGAEEFIKNKIRYCLWLVNASPTIIKNNKLIFERVEACKEDRLLGAPDRQKLADTPALFRETLNPKSYIIVPSVSSEKRRYVPLGFLGEDTIPTNLVQIIPDATLYHFGVLTSNVHMAWMRAVCGRLKSDYRYSKDIVYNNFPWPEVSEEQKAKIEQTAQAILDARALYPDSSLADLYDEVTMPVELRKAHQQNDRAVMAAYGFPVKDFTESDCVAHLLQLYKQLTQA
ncbi:MAG: methylase [Muribaculaceae bacterium]|nr:methylase [Muribaculaceae bacterium]